MNEEILKQDGLDESLRTYIESNVVRSEETEIIEESNAELEVTENEIEEIVGETEEVDSPSIDDVIIDETIDAE
jgi:hypothetical protein